MSTEWRKNEHPNEKWRDKYIKVRIRGEKKLRNRKKIVKQIKSTEKNLAPHSLAMYI